MTNDITLDSRMFDALEITAYTTVEDRIEVRVINDGMEVTECVAHLVEDNRIDVKEGNWYLPFMTEEFRMLEVSGVMDGEIGHIRRIEDHDGENVVYDRIADDDDYPGMMIENRMPEMSFKAMKAEKDGFTGLRVIYGEEWLEAIIRYLESRAE